jgi:hypothetical protein
VPPLPSTIMAPPLLSILAETHKTRPASGRKEELCPMTKLTAILVLLASFLLLAPVIASGTSSSLPVFQAVGSAYDGGGAE